MKQLTHFIAMMIITIILLGSTQPVFAQEDRPATGRPRGIRGEVTAIAENSFILLNRAGESVTVNVSADTVIQLMKEGRGGSLADIKIGDVVGARGPRNEGSIEARFVVVLPENPENLAGARGRVTSIENEVLVVENPQGTRRIVTDANTNFRIGQAPAELADIKIDDRVFAVGLKQGDDTFVAQLVVVVTGEQLRKHTLRGEVLNVDSDAGTLTVEAKGQKEGIWTVETTAETQYRIPGVENPTLADIESGDRVLVLGRPADDGSQSGTARLIIVIPQALQNSIRVRGEVTAIDGTTFTLAAGRGDMTILTDDATQYLAPGNSEVSFDDIEVGSRVIVAGEPVEGREKTLRAKLIGMKAAD